MAEVLTVEVGRHLWLEGTRWSVAELTGDTVVLSAGPVVRRVRVADLPGAAAQDPVEDGGESDPSAVILAAVTPKQRAAAEAKARVIRPIAKLPADDRTMDRKCQAAAVELTISLRQVYRLVARYQQQGVAGLVDARLLQETRRSVDPAWDAACRHVLNGYRDLSNPTIKTVIAEANALYLAEHPSGSTPTRSVAYQRVRELDKGRYTFGVAKQRRSVAERPEGVLGRLRATRPGQYVVMDTTRLDVFAMEPVTLRWVNVELTVAMDLYSRCITGISLRPVAAKAADAASVLYQTVTEQHWGPTEPSTDVGGDDSVVSPPAGSVLPGVVPDTVILDRGKVYVSEHLLGVCHRLGINVQPAIPYKPTDKPTIERFFRTLRQQLLEHLPAYKGPDVAARGLGVEAHAFLYVDELARVIREWVGIYHATPHAGLVDPHLPHVELSPGEMFARGVAQAGLLRLPASMATPVEFLAVVWRTIQHYGVEINGRRYDGPALNYHRGVRSTYGGAHAGKWPFMVDVDDIRTVWFRNPDDNTWHQLQWEHAPGLSAPFSAEAADYTRRLSQTTNRHVDPAQAVQDLLGAWAKDEVVTRRHRALARRLAAQRATTVPATVEGSPPPDAGDGRETASVPGVIDLLQRLEQRTKSEQIRDDADVFDRYYAEHPDQVGFEVFED